MSVVDVVNVAGEVVSQTELKDSIFNVPVKKSVLHQVVVAQLAARRAGSASVKHRSDVKGSRRKLYRQKGTGRARKGDIKSPILRGGGSVFGPDPRDYTPKVLKKVRKMALKMALTCRAQDQQLVVVDKIDLDGGQNQGFCRDHQSAQCRKGADRHRGKDERWRFPPAMFLVSRFFRRRA
jgi:large subunit ribosomal protein L4